MKTKRIFSAMKSKIVLFGMLFAVIFACKNDDDLFVQNITHKVLVNYGEIYGEQPAENVTVTFANRQNGVTYIATTDKDGYALVELPTGSYDITATQQLTAEQMRVLSGTETEAVFNASLSGVVINSSNSNLSVLNLVTGKVGDLLIKQVYYVSSSTTEAAGNGARDQFFEIHNNSNQTIYLDNLCVAQLYGWTPRMAKQNLQANGQLDWSKSETLVGSGNEVNTDYVYAYEVISFPGSGNDYPLESGKSVIVARSALNHKAPLTIGNISYTVPNPDLTVDLSKAPFETYYADYQKSTAGIDRDIDNPTVPNMNLLKKVNINYDFILNYIGRDALVIFRKTSDFDTWKEVKGPEYRASATRFYLQIPVSVVIDGVNLHAVDGSENPHRCPESIDAGEITPTKGLYSSQSAVRKVVKQVGDRVFYQDTNNSLNDFDIIDLPDVNSIK